MPSLETEDGRTLSWRETGSGPLLVVHPGGPGCSAAYFGELPGVAEHHTLVLLDPRGTGGSTRPADSSAYDLEDYAADIEALREHLGLDKLALLGHSHGGFIAQAWAGAHPGSVDRLILASTAPRFTDEIRNRRLERALSHREESYFDDAMDALQNQQAGNYSSDDELMALYARASRIMAPPGEDLATVAKAMMEAGINSDVVKHFNEHVAGGMDLRPALQRIDAPTLVLVGEVDPFGGPTADEMAEHLQDATLVTVPGDHFPFLEPENRAEWERAVVDFLRR